MAAVVHIALLAAAAVASGQSAPPGGAPTSTPPPVTGLARSLVVEWIIVAVMCGLALFAVCRSSRRN